MDNTQCGELDQAGESPSEDTGNLFQHIGEKKVWYREVRSEEHFQSRRNRWPLLAEVQTEEDFFALLAGHPPLGT